MKLALTSLGFSTPEEVVRNTLIKSIEVVPYKIKPWNELDGKDVVLYTDYLESLGLAPTSFLSLLYGIEVKDINDTQAILRHLKRVICYAKLMGVKVLVFGSPGLRKRVPGWIDSITTICQKVDKELKGTDIKFLIEPVTSFYKSEFFTRLEDIVPFLESNQFTNVGTMLDMHSCMHENLDVVTEYQRFNKYIQHVHVNEMDLGKLYSIEAHNRFAKELHKSNYQGIITLETIKPDCYDSVNIFEKIYS